MCGTCFLMCYHGKQCNPTFMVDAPRVKMHTHSGKMESGKPPPASPPIASMLHLPTRSPRSTSRVLLTPHLSVRALLALIGFRMGLAGAPPEMEMAR